VRHAVLQPHPDLAQIVKETIGLIPWVAGAELLQQMISEQRQRLDARPSLEFELVAASPGECSTRWGDRRNVPGNRDP
jgi:hypothetical protein